MRATANPAWLATWSALIFTLGMLAYLLTGVDALDTAMFSLAFLPWLAGPTLLAAYLARKASVRWAGWALLAIELGAAASTVAFWAYLDAHPDAQNGIAIAFLPVWQFPAVLIASLPVLLLEHVLVGTRRGEREDG